MATKLREAADERPEATDGSVRHELLAASDMVIDDAVQYCDPMVIRGLLYQLTADPELLAMPTKLIMGFFPSTTPANDDDIVLLRRKLADFLKQYRDVGAGEIDYGPRERLPASLCLASGDTIPDEHVALYIEEFALDPWARSLRWRSPPAPEQLERFNVTVIGAGMGGLNAALQLKRAGIPFTVLEKNGGVGGTWYENRYPGARVDTPSRSYTHIFGADFGYPNPFCERIENQKYFDWVADNFGLRQHIQFDTEVHSLTWDEATASWEIRMSGPGGERVHRSRAVITAVGFLNRPNLPAFAGLDEFRGPSWHSARWPQDFDLRGKRIAVVGTGATGYQMIPDIALQAEHVTVFQRTPQWVFGIPGYRSPFPPQVSWLDRNLPLHTNFMRFRSSYGGPAFGEIMTIDPEFDDPHAVSAGNKRARDACMAFLTSKVSDPELIAKMTPEHPVWSARAIMVDSDYSILDAIQRDNVSLVASEVKRVDRTGIEAEDGSRHEVDAIVFATGFHATEYLYPMTITGRGGMTTAKLWEKDGARAYQGCMMPGFPNLWSIYGPNTNGSLNVASFHELIALNALLGMQHLILEGKRAIDVKEDAYWTYNHRLDAENSRKVWSDPRASNYYWTKFGRSAVQNPLSGVEMWQRLRKLNFDDLIVD